PATFRPVSGGRSRLRRVGRDERAATNGGVVAREEVLVEHFAVLVHRARLEHIAAGDGDTLRECRVGGLIRRGLYEVLLRRGAHRDRATCWDPPDIDGERCPIAP